MCRASCFTSVTEPCFNWYIVGLQHSLYNSHSIYPPQQKTQCYPAIDKMQSPDKTREETVQIPRWLARFILC
jgi:hypothetical protein